MASRQWNAFAREAGISAQAISEGLATLRKANYASTGLYSHAFFNLSIGIERMLKIIFMLEWALNKNGKLPSDQDLRAFGHDIEKLFQYAEKLQKSMKDNQYFRCFHADDKIEREILKFLSSFARRTRYYNLDYLTNSPRAQADVDPIAGWYNDIGSQIFARHLTSARKEKIERNAAVIDIMIGSVSSVSFTAEDGSSVADVFTASRQTGMNELLQKYGAFYCARLVRYLYMILYNKCHEIYGTELDIPLMYEVFFPFMNEDNYLLRRKTFPPRGQGR